MTTMALCALCKTVKPSNLPSIAEEPNAGCYMAGNRDMPRLMWVDDERFGSAEAPDDPLGFKWHADLDALARSAADCALCALVQKASRYGWATTKTRSATIG